MFKSVACYVNVVSDFVICSDYRIVLPEKKSVTNWNNNVSVATILKVSNYKYVRVGVLSLAFCFTVCAITLD